MRAMSENCAFLSAYDRFVQELPRLRDGSLYQYVAFNANGLIGTDSDSEQLIEKLRKRYGPEEFFLGQVLPEEEGFPADPGNVFASLPR